MRAVLALLGVCFSASSILANQPPTFTKDVAPILWNHCASCHRPGEIGPFPLLTYQDAAKRAKFLVDVTESRRMPPWKPAPGHGKFQDERRLGDAELATLAKWAQAGAPEGDAKDLPKMPSFPEGWQLGTPDLILKMPESFTVPAEGRDLLQCFVIPMGLQKDQMVAAWEFRPGNRKVVHHAILYTDHTGQARLRDRLDPKPGYQSFGGPGILPSGGLGGWAPGSTPRFLPDGTGKFLRNGSDLVLQIHYHPNGKEEIDQSQVGIYFVKKPVKTIVGGIALRSRNILIPPGKADYTIRTESDPLPADAYAIGIAPHMHYIGKSVKVTAHKPDGSEESLLWIPEWDFNWQGAYAYEKPVKLPKGTVVKLEAIYDNSENNPFNPSHPPKLVKWGEQTTDEMCLLGIPIITDSTADLRKIMSMSSNRLASVLMGAPNQETLDRIQSESGASHANSATPPAGMPIPERFQRLFKRYDKNNDGRLSTEEIDAMPEVLRNRIKQRLENPATEKPN
ncbi:ascorbate-dependent monooxygenase [Tuwongella immobilis]|uniref:EF-hand domain-containing protein n=1 Tax=Tuwongella immobilis TaxID=692036 RepID=A0A6C2YR04_9BACT|nr:ascorbate-dependent monooxygenase [Tuwongella immobilis]VIP03533.1 alkyl hydroperoxide reductase : Calcium-binding EF-hand-containing protein OS=Solibacter usitatus (strain Ellin6076) GN=Acid_2373 PE=4 SV=1: Cu2_monoox_C [Tuwongella immobilis]VTS04434.1 alkyl hydroperoxide reductase : Calcium-binding EF-hand-containing protein OS=Solibacter usitatus (strain Ellin6076) GN=Acid_2373 PE=4 SV=1: Cu2_monoox_C [Tuwongella immobilis]